ncbi:MAG: hypothetical protein VYC39_11355 [Myxococcota bacterium]|nr:hypothetical protein [Myxococcota bacterium]
MLNSKFFLMLMVTAIAGCAHTDPALSLQPRTSMKASDYEKVLEDWTREDRLYDGLESKLFVHATFHSPEFRKTFLLRHPDVYGRGSETARRLALTLPDAGEDIEFFFSAFTTDIRWNDFDQVDSIWRVELKSNHSESVDGEVTRVKTTANLRAIYPFITDFSRTYVVRFPRTDASGKPVLASSSEEIELHFRSALGGAKLMWKLIPVATGRREPFPPTRELVTR